MHKNDCQPLYRVPGGDGVVSGGDGVVSGGDGVVSGGDGVVSGGDVEVGHSAPQLRVGCGLIRGSSLSQTSSLTVVVVPLLRVHIHVTDPVCVPSQVAEHTEKSFLVHLQTDKTCRLVFTVWNQLHKNDCPVLIPGCMVGDCVVVGIIRIAQSCEPQ